MAQFLPAPAGRLSLLCLLALTPAVVVLDAAQKTTEAPATLYQQGQQERALGLKDLAQAAPLRAAARHHFETAAGHFAAAARGFADRAKGASGDLEWAACAQCAHAEMLLREGKTAEARDLVAALLKDPLLSRSSYRKLALYYHGFACFLTRDYVAAGRSLSGLAPFSDPDYGIQARFLLARVQHLTGERPEAAVQYAGVLADYENQKQQAGKALEQPEHFKNDAAARARLAALRDGPPPEPVIRAAFCLGVLLYEGGRYDLASARCSDFMAQHSTSPLRDRAQLCLGLCQVQLNQCTEAVQTLQPLVEKKTTLTGQALLWLAKAQAAQANAAEPEAYQQALKEARATLQQALALDRDATDAAGKARRGEVLIELAEVNHLVDQDGEAAALFGQILAEHLLPQREEELLQRRLSALTRAGKYESSDLLCTQFVKAYPRSILLPEVLFRHAENAHFRLEAAGKDDLPRLNEETARRYRTVIERYPDFAHVNLARHGLALTYFRRGDRDKAREVLETIPGPDRRDELAVVSYLLAECLLRQAPARADDALASGRLEEQLRTATEALTGYINDPPEQPLVAEALLRLGFCQVRLAALMANEEEKTKLRQSARATYERLLLDFPLHDLQPHAALERARCLALAGETGPAMRHLRRFTMAPLKKSTVAPLAVLQLATILRGQDNKTAEVVRLLAQCRLEHEAILASDPARAAWVQLLRYHHAVALKEAGKLPEARALLEGLMKDYPDRPLSAEAALRWGQCLNEEGWQKIETVREKIGAQGLTPEEATAADKALAEGRKTVQDAVRHLETQADRVMKKEQPGELPAMMLYEVAWIHRGLGDLEVAAARGRIQEALLKKLKEEAAKKTPEGQPAPPVVAPEVPLTRVPLQPAEKQAREVYGRLLKAFPDSPLVHNVRLELGEILAERGETPAALKLLNEALDKEPPAGLSDKIRLRLGAGHLAQGDRKAALRQFELVARTPDSGLAGQGHLRAAECLMEKDQWAEAIPHLVPFRDREGLQALGGLSDRGLLQLGYVLAQQGKWDDSRKAFEQVPARFADSPWIEEARYQVGWTWFKQKEYGKAVAALSALPADKVTEPAARAQVLLGVCRVELKLDAEAAAVLESVPGKYAFPELSALALVEAALARTQLKQGAQAEKLLRQVIHDYPQSAAAALAREQLQGGQTAKPHTVAAGTRLLTPAMLKPLPLDILGEQQANQATLDDPTAEASLATALNRAPPDRTAPAPQVHLAVPDPFEQRAAVRHMIPAEEDILPQLCTPRPPRP